MYIVSIKFSHIFLILFRSVFINFSLYDIYVCINEKLNEFPSHFLYHLLRSSDFLIDKWILNGFYDY